MNSEKMINSEVKVPFIQILSKSWQYLLAHQHFSCIVMLGSSKLKKTFSLVYVFKTFSEHYERKSLNSNKLLHDNIFCFIGMFRLAMTLSILILFRLPFFRLKLEFQNFFFIHSCEYVAQLKNELKVNSFI